MASGIPYTFLQPTFFMQNMLMFAEPIRTQRAFYLPLGNSKVSWVDARDIAEVGLVALTQPGHENKEYPITAGERNSVAPRWHRLSATSWARPSTVSTLHSPPPRGAGSPRVCLNGWPT